MYERDHQQSSAVFTTNFEAIMLQYSNLLGHESVANHWSLPASQLLGVLMMHGPEKALFTTDSSSECCDQWLTDKKVESMFESVKM